MLRLKKRNTTPPGGYRDVAPQTGFPFYADSLADLIAKEKNHLKANNLSVPTDLAEQIENRLCHLMPEGICESTDGEQYQGGASRTASHRILNATIGICKGNVVGASEAARRAVLCVECPHNARHAGCSTCKGITASLNSLAAGRSTPSDSQLQVCDILGAFNRILVWQADAGRLHRAGLWSKCWLKGAK